MLCLRISDSQVQMSEPQIRFRAHINEPLEPEPPMESPSETPVVAPPPPSPCCPMAPPNYDDFATKLLLGLAIAYTAGLLTGTLIFSPSE